MATSLPGNFLRRPASGPRSQVLLAQVSAKICCAAGASHAKLAVARQQNLRKLWPHRQRGVCPCSVDLLEPGHQRVAPPAFSSTEMCLAVSRFKGEEWDRSEQTRTDHSVTIPAGPLRDHRPHQHQFSALTFVGEAPVSWGSWNDPWHLQDQRAPWVSLAAAQVGEALARSDRIPKHLADREPFAMLSFSTCRWRKGCSQLHPAKGLWNSPVSHESPQLTGMLSASANSRTSRGWP